MNVNMNNVVKVKVLTLKQIPLVNQAKAILISFKYFNKHLQCIK